MQLHNSPSRAVISLVTIMASAHITITVSRAVTSHAITTRASRAVTASSAPTTTVPAATTTRVSKVVTASSALITIIVLGRVVIIAIRAVSTVPARVDVSRKTTCVRARALSLVPSVWNMKCRCLIRMKRSA